MNRLVEQTDRSTVGSCGRNWNQAQGAASRRASRVCAHKHTHVRKHTHTHYTRPHRKWNLLAVVLHYLRVRTVHSLSPPIFQFTSPSHPSIPSSFPPSSLSSFPLSPPHYPPHSPLHLLHSLPHPSHPPTLLTLLSVWRYVWKISCRGHSWGFVCVCVCVLLSLLHFGGQIAHMYKLPSSGQWVGVTRFNLYLWYTCSDCFVWPILYRFREFPNYCSSPPPPLLISCPYFIAGNCESSCWSVVFCLTSG